MFGRSGGCIKDDQAVEADCRRYYYLGCECRYFFETSGAVEVETMVGDDYAGASLTAGASGSISAGCSVRDAGCYVTLEGTVYVGAEAHAKATAEGCASSAGDINYAVCGERQ